jgi:acetyltransferase-like isoleucine patch superfamily enzyme
VHVGTGAYLGARSVVREGVRVGDWSLLGMGSLLLRDLPPRTAAYGAPAVPVRDAELNVPRALTSALETSPVPPPIKEPPA